MSFSAGFAAGLAVGKKKWGEGSGGDDWIPPDWWITVPEPGEYEMYFLVQIFSASEANIIFGLSRPEDASTGNGSISIDWGDGSTYNSDGGWFPYADFRHAYADVGQYLIKITTSDGCRFLQQINGTVVLVAKLGAEIVLNNDNITGQTSHTQRAFYNQRHMQWAVINCKSGLPRDKAFEGCYALKKVDMAVPPTIIGDDTFVNCRCLTKFDFSNVVTIKNNGAYQSGFKKINAPLCERVYDTAFSYCYNLQEIVVADDCTFGNNCFSECYSLYPRPDGSVN